MNDIFPLPLTALEIYMVQASWPGDPILNDSTLIVAGEVDRVAFEQGLRRALELNPLFRCRLEWPKGGGPRWVLADPAGIELFWDAPSAPACWNDDFELSAGPGMRIWKKPLPDGRSCLWLRYHHAISDGIGISRFWGDLLQEYSRLRSPAGAALGKWSDPELPALKLRGSIASKRSWIERARAAWHLLQLTRAKVTPLAPPSDRAPAPWPAGELACDVIPSEPFAKLRERASAHGVTFNDYLLATMFRTIAVWNERHGDPRPSDRLRVMVPTSTREKRHARMPAANCIGFAMIDRSASECASRDALLPGLARETRAMLEGDTGAGFVDLVALRWTIARLRGQFVRHRRTRRSSRAITTVTLSYLGDLERVMPRGGPHDERGRHICGDIVLLEPGGTAPRQDATRIALAGLYYRDELYLNLTADPISFDYAQAMDFLGLFRSLLLADVEVARIELDAARARQLELNAYE